MSDTIFNVGDKLRVKGLVAKPQYNGCEGVVIGEFIEEKKKISSENTTK